MLDVCRRKCKERGLACNLLEATFETLSNALNIAKNSLNLTKIIGSKEDETRFISLIT